MGEYMELNDESFHDLSPMDWIRMAQDVLHEVQAVFDIPELREIESCLEMAAQSLQGDLEVEIMLEQPLDEVFFSLN